MADRKYVILQDLNTGKEYAVIFDRDLSHSAVSRGIERTMAHDEWSQRMLLMPVAAGFADEQLTVYHGRTSESLKLGPRPEDQEILRPSPLLPSIVDKATLERAQRDLQKDAPRRGSFLERARNSRGRR